MRLLLLTGNIEQIKSIVTIIVLCPIMYYIIYNLYVSELHRYITRLISIPNYIYMCRLIIF